MVSVFNGDYHSLQQASINTGQIKSKVAFTDIKNQIAADSAVTNSGALNSRKTATTPHKPITVLKSCNIDLDGGYEACSYDSSCDFLCGKEFSGTDVKWHVEDYFEEEAPLSSCDSVMDLDAINSSTSSSSSILYCREFPSTWDEIDDGFCDSGFDNNFSESIPDFNSTLSTADTSLPLPDFDWDL